MLWANSKAGAGLAAYHAQAGAQSQAQLGGQVQQATAPRTAVPVTSAPVTAATAPTPYQAAAGQLTAASSGGQIIVRQAEHGAAGQDAGSFVIPPLTAQSGVPGK